MLHKACAKGDVRRVKELLKRGEDVDAPHGNGATPLWIACENGQTEIAQLLLEWNADPNLPEEQGASPLYIAAQNGHLDVVQQLLRHPFIDVDLAKRSGATPVLMAAQSNNVPILRELWLHGADLNRPMHNGVSPFINACFQGHEAAAAFLVSAGVDMKYAHKKPGIEWARDRGHLRCAVLIMQTKNLIHRGYLRDAYARWREYKRPPPPPDPNAPPEFGEIIPEEEAGESDTASQPQETHLTLLEELTGLIERVEARHVRGLHDHPVLVRSLEETKRNISAAADALQFVDSRLPEEEMLRMQVDSMIAAQQWPEPTPRGPGSALWLAEEAERSEYQKECDKLIREMEQSVNETISIMEATNDQLASVHRDISSSSPVPAAEERGDFVAELGARPRRPTLQRLQEQRWAVQLETQQQLGILDARERTEFQELKNGLRAAVWRLGNTDTELDREIQGRRASPLRSVSPATASPPRITPSPTAMRPSPVRTRESASIITGILWKSNGLQLDWQKCLHSLESDGLWHWTARGVKVLGLRRDTITECHENTPDHAKLPSGCDRLAAFTIITVDRNIGCTLVHVLVAESRLSKQRWIRALSQVAPVTAASSASTGSNASPSGGRKASSSGISRFGSFRGRGSAAYRSTTLPSSAAVPQSRPSRSPVASRQGSAMSLASLVLPTYAQATAATTVPQPAALVPARGTAAARSATLAAPYRAAQSQLSSASLPGSAVPAKPATYLTSTALARPPPPWRFTAVPQRERSPIPLGRR
eukprot:TRINITY_DN16564_c0_g1_i1.p1 TRINITY_DN16564_c0_g1~~TRINITY_DN16564_c0_g1_i1.p1  ORF type:complete len:767 (-),score=96.25 TRINITY_DN16564_c0_g1_i1:68-2368(-)